MKYLIAIETIKLVETDVESEEAAIELVKQKINYKPTDTTIFKIVKEAIYNEETNTYGIFIEKTGDETEKNEEP